MQNCVDAYSASLNVEKAKEACIELKNQTQSPLYQKCMMYFLKHEKVKNVRNFIVEGHATTTAVIEQILFSIIAKDFEYFFDMTKDASVRRQLEKVIPNKVDECFTYELKNFKIYFKNYIDTTLGEAKLETRQDKFCSLAYKAIKYAVKTNNETLYKECLEIICKNPNFFVKASTMVKKPLMKLADDQDLLLLKFALENTLDLDFNSYKDGFQLRVDQKNYKHIQGFLGQSQSLLDNNVKFNLLFQTDFQNTTEGQFFNKFLTSLLASGCVQKFLSLRNPLQENEIAALTKGIEKQNCTVS
ncbi:MAG: hypothetical protein H0T62_11825 [Parachlamydiaceae bacterium]|nr:hypothetical protein [Parachlamydiaceae bacterium]